MAPPLQRTPMPKAARLTLPFRWTRATLLILPPPVVPPPIPRPPRLENAATAREGNGEQRKSACL
eukprot:5696393-Pyramimonas_sp.AAC.1